MSGRSIGQGDRVAALHPVLAGPADRETRSHGPTVHRRRDREALRRRAIGVDRARGHGRPVAVRVLRAQVHVVGLSVAREVHARRVGEAHVRRSVRPVPHVVEGVARSARADRDFVNARGRQTRDGVADGRVGEAQVRRRVLLLPVRSLHDDGDDAGRTDAVDAHVRRAGHVRERQERAHAVRVLDGAGVELDRVAEHDAGARFFADLHGVAEADLRRGRTRRVGRVGRGRADLQRDARRARHDDAFLEGHDEVEVLPRQIDAVRGDGDARYGGTDVVDQNPRRRGRREGPHGVVAGFVFERASGEADGRREGEAVHVVVGVLDRVTVDERRSARAAHVNGRAAARVELHADLAAADGEDGLREGHRKVQRLAEAVGSEGRSRHVRDRRSQTVDAHLR